MVRLKHRRVDSAESRIQRNFCCYFASTLLFAILTAQCLDTAESDSVVTQTPLSLTLLSLSNSVQSQIPWSVVNIFMLPFQCHGVSEFYSGLGNHSFALSLLCSFALSLFRSFAFRSSLFCSFQKELQGAICSFALFQKSEKEQFALSLFTKRATKRESLFRSFKKSDNEQITLLLFKKSDKEQIALSLFTKRATNTNSLFCSLPKEQKSAQ